MKKSDYRKPLLLTFAIERGKGCEDVGFHYDYNRDMNVMNVDPAIPFIDAGKYTKTYSSTIAGAAFDSMGGHRFSELYTKTDEARETDDEEMCFAELETKTEVDRER